MSASLELLGILLSLPKLLGAVLIGVIYLVIMYILRRKGYDV